MGRIAYVNGRFVPHGQAAVHIEDRGYQLADGVYEVWAVFDGRLADAEGHFERLERSLGELRIAEPMSREALMIVLSETVRPQPGARRPGLSAGHRGVAPRDHAFPDPPAAPAVVVTAKSIDRRRRRGPGGQGRGRDHPAGEPLGPLRHQDRRPAAQCAGQAGGARGRAPPRPGSSTTWAWSPRAPPPTPGSSTPTAPAHPRHQRQHPARHHPHQPL